MTQGKHYGKRELSKMKEVRHMKGFFELIDGYKSYVGAVGLFVLGGLLALKVIDQKTFEALAAVVGAWSVMSLKSAISKLE